MGFKKCNIFNGLSESPARGPRDEALQFRRLWAISPARSDLITGPRARNPALMQDFRPDFRTPFD
jgi:hypothetical protein